MINENNELIITTSEAFEVIRIINKLNMKDSLVSSMVEFTRLEQQSQQEYRKVSEIMIKEIGSREEYLNLSEEDKTAISNKVLAENNNIQESLVKINETQTKTGMDILYDFISKIPMAEKEVYKCLSKIFNKPIKEVETQELDKTIEMIKEVVKCKSIISFFK